MVKINQIPLFLGEPAIQFLWDFLNHQESPHIRDHLSHGEISLSKFPKEATNQFTDEDRLSMLKEKAVIKSLVGLAEGYSVPFHPVSQLKKNLLSCEKSIISNHSGSAHHASKHQHTLHPHVQPGCCLHGVETLAVGKGSSIKFLSLVLYPILSLIVLELVNIHVVHGKKSYEYLKFLKMFLQYAENLVAYTSQQKNKWNKTINLTWTAMLKI
ncbi:hypothetical protein GH733_015226 [Mirounga leonina]|nr:hypothetical protein GH733_015226 [Mirounga leonina]